MFASPIRPNVIDAIVDAGRVFGAHLGTVLGVSFVLQGLKFAVLASLFTTLGEDHTYIVGAVWALILLTLSSGVFAQLAFDLRIGVPDRGPIDLLRRTLPLLPGLLLVAVMLVFGLTVGFFLLILPGIYLAMRWSLVVPAKVAGKLSASDAFSASWRLTDGVLGWALLLVAFYAFAIELIPALADSLIGRDAPLTSWLAVEATVSGLVSPMIALTIAMFFIALADQRGAIVGVGDEDSGDAAAPPPPADQPAPGDPQPPEPRQSIPPPGLE